MIRLTAADVADSTGAIPVLEALKDRWPGGIKHLFSDGAYDRAALLDQAGLLDFVVEVVKRHVAQVGFEVLPRRWVVDRKFDWMIRHRRLVRDYGSYEERLNISQAMIHITLGSLLLRRLLVRTHFQSGPRSS